MRVGLLIDSFVQPRWRYKIIEDIKSSSIAEIVLVVENGAFADQKRSPFVQKVWTKRNSLLYEAYSHLDDLIYKVEPDAFEDVDAAPLLQDCPVIRVNPTMKKYSDYFPDKDVEAILAFNLDVALRFGFRILKGRVLQIAKNGVWSYHHGDNLVNRGIPPGFWEVMNDEPVTGSILQLLTEELDNGKVIYRSWAPTINRFSVKTNNNNYYWKSSSFVPRKLKELYELNGETPDEAHGERPYLPYYNRLYKVPTNIEMLPLILRLIGRFVSRLWEKLWSFDQWFLSYRIKSGPADTNNVFHRFKNLIPPKDRFWADPFPVKVGDKFFIFVEELIYKRQKAHISVIEVDKHGMAKDPVKVLERDYHLSYPFILEWQDKYYMIPESSDNKTVELYRCVSFPSEWKLEKVLLEANNPADATLIEIDGLWWMFVSIGASGASKNWDELHIFYSASPLGPWRPHRRNPVKSDVRCSRPAGRLFYVNGDLFRPAQDCSKHYGYGISINKVIQLTPDEFHEEEVSKILPEWNKRIIGTHTLNSYDDITVIDCLMKRRRFS
ncbi:MAG: hypothetical protein M3410_03425 [Acidobacteriota bacterium]|nr:hypothetical protein [Acidobacteriota bacterium]